MIQLPSQLESTILQSEYIRLEPLQESHLNGIQLAVQDGKLFELFFTFVPTPENALEYIRTALQMRMKDGALPFAIVAQKTNHLIGSTRFFNFAPQHRRVEIGHTWLAKSYQKGIYNVDCKLLLLQHAFEVWQMFGVELRTDFLNFTSRQAIEKLGARLDGVLRRHTLMPDGRMRDTMVYSILDQEWMGVKSMLLLRKKRYSSMLADPNKSS